MAKVSTGSAKSAPIVMQGHTSDDTQGSNPQSKGKGQRKPRDLKAK